MRWGWLLLLACSAVGGCSDESGEVMTITFPDPAQGDALVDGVWTGSRSYSGTRYPKLETPMPEEEWPCKDISRGITGTTSPWDKDTIVNGTIWLKTWNCKEPIKPWTIEIVR